MVDVLDEGRRPSVAPGEGSRARAAAALEVCPGAELTQDPRDFPSDALGELRSGWGPVLELWEGYASDPEVRFQGSSGGAATAVALHCLADEGMHGILHIAADPQVPYLNQTVLSRSRDEMLAATGSRYAPASPCDSLQKIADAPSPCVFIGKPCDVAATAKARRKDPDLDRNLGLTIGIFCAGTPSTLGTFEMLRRMGFDRPETVASVRYRGLGWPGRARAEGEQDGARVEHSLSYEESWDEILQKHRQWRCHICPDHTGEYADIAVGDPWYRSIPDDEPGRSLVLVRTERGRRVLQGALESGALTLERVEPWVLPASQPNLLRNRGALWGRVWAMRMLGLATPRFRGFATFSAWIRHVHGWEKARSFGGTFKRVFRKSLYKRKPVEASGPRGESS
jgi:coenzyme F420 hydrogenase subunit beta